MSNLGPWADGGRRWEALLPSLWCISSTCIILFCLVCPGTDPYEHLEVETRIQGRMHILILNSTTNHVCFRPVYTSGLVRIHISTLKAVPILAWPLCKLSKITHASYQQHSIGSTRTCVTKTLLIGGMRRLTYIKEQSVSCLSFTYICHASAVELPEWIPALPYRRSAAIGRARLRYNAGILTYKMPGHDCPSLAAEPQATLRDAATLSQLQVSNSKDAFRNKVDHRRALDGPEGLAGQLRSRSLQR